MRTVTLSTGIVVPNKVYLSTIQSLHQLQNKYPLALYELAQKARNHNHQIHVGSWQALTYFNLISTFHDMHPMVRDIVKATVVGEGYDLKLENGIRI